jgi:hypothetical protein
MFTVPTLADVDKIASLRNPVIRNLQITQCYHELAAGVVARIGPHANWCSFATWASKQAGQTIRKEDLARALEQRLMHARAIGRAINNVAAEAKPSARTRPLATTRRSLFEALNPLAALQRASDAVARGNQKVFAEIGREFAHFCAGCLMDAAPDENHITQFCTNLRPGDPPDGQRYLQQAFSRYYQAMFEGDVKQRTELMLLANLEIGFHEQTRLQPEIQAAMEATKLDGEAITRQILSAVLPSRSRNAYEKMQTRRALGQRSPLDDAINDLLRVLRKHLRLFLTDQLMTLWVPPDTTLRLGDDLSAQFPPVLQRIANPALRALLKQIDPTSDSTSQSGADDWADLPDRLHFIADFFRCYQELPQMQWTPFTPSQVATLKLGKRPSGRL